MIGICLLAGMACAMFSATCVLVAGYSWWVVLASYVVTGTLAVPLVAALCIGLAAVRRWEAEKATSVEMPGLASKHS